jgi:threonyl-tRNA synthetase
MNDFQEREINSELDTLRHSCAHIMAHAVSRLYPGARFGIGPTTDDGFYYDIEIDKRLTPEDLPKIEAEMKKIIKEGCAFERNELSIEDAISYFEKKDQKFKVEIIRALAEMGETKVSTYTEGDFVDLCRGPHLKSAKEVPAFKLLSIAGAYWRGNEKNPQLQRIYGTAFFSESELDEHLHLLEEAKKRDHRKLGRELDLFSFHPEAPGSPFFHPKGTIVYNRLQKLMRDLYRIYGYDEVITPQILDVDLWKKSGHYDNYRENMYFTEVENRHFAVKPMNCPAATFIYSSSRRSYRELPIRLADFGRLHRFEKSGTLHGLTRVRSFCQDDAHIFCTAEQIEQEIEKTVEMILKVYELFGFETKIGLSTRPEKRVGSDALWDQAEKALRQVLDNLGKPYFVNEGDGAFYGPKIDFQVRDALKRDFQLATIQLDFNLPERFELNFIGSDNAIHRPVMIHRAVLGSIERFMGILVEHTAGAFPFWLAPVQARIIPIKNTHNDYCHEFQTKLLKLGYRVDVDDRNESMGLKTREAQIAKIPFSLAAGDREIARGEFAVRKYGEREMKVMTQQEIMALFDSLEAPARF